MDMQSFILITAAFLAFVIVIVLIVARVDIPAQFLNSMGAVILACVLGLLAHWGLKG